MSEKINQFLISLRLEKNLTKEQLAKILDINIILIEHIERCSVSKFINMVLKYSDYFDIPVEKFLKP